MKRSKRIIAFIMTLALVLAYPATSWAINGDGTGGDATISKKIVEIDSKQLDDNYNAKVALSVPAKEKQYESDVVFVLDKSSSAPVKESAYELLDRLKGNDTKINVGVVAFCNSTVTLPLSDLDENYQEIKDFIEVDRSSLRGTNIHAGLIAGQKMLADDTSIDDSRKFLVLVTDGVSYMYCTDTDADGNPGDAKVSSVYYYPMGNGTWDLFTLDQWTYKYNDGSYCDGTETYDWDKWYQTVDSRYQQEGYEYPNRYLNNEYKKGEGSPRDYTPVVEDKETKKSQYIDRYYNEALKINNTVDMALYGMYNVYKECESKYNTYVFESTNKYRLDSKKGKESYYPWADSFMSYMAGDNYYRYTGEPTDFDFSDVKNDILYFVSKGSTVLDIMGSGVDEKTGISYDYDFLVDENHKLTLSVGDTEYDAVDLGDNQYGFGGKVDDTYEYVLTYYPDGAAEDKVPEGVENNDSYILDINTNVEYANPITLYYYVHLNLEAGDKELVENSVVTTNTNNVAILQPVDSEDTPLTPQEFEKPEIDITIDKDSPIWPQGDDPTDPSDDPTDPSDDPTDDPTDPSDDPTESNQDDSADTGDHMNIMLFAGLMLLSAAGACAVCVRRREE